MLHLAGVFHYVGGIGLEERDYTPASLVVDEERTTLTGEFPRCVVDLYEGDTLVIPRIFVSSISSVDGDAETTLRALLLELKERCNLVDMDIAE